MRITGMALTLVLVGLIGCSEETPAGPTTQDFNKARAERAAKGTKARVQASARRAEPQPEAAEPAFATNQSDYSYDRRQKRDPFRSYEWEQLKLEMSDADARGPLEQFDVAQLTVVGVVWNNHNARALVQDPSGMSYIVGQGTRIGKNDGRVTSINDNLVVVKETYVDFLGEETSKDVEMRIRATEGG